ncbi:hypothetical protein L202_08361 [Cryptococcus amylolentus CBS 6039]|uniref:Cyclin-D1-binding protein 1-like N-terminal domain-containing protein n=3 Tax=Cryptococcus amylolentus TaxID=104669 RepID=A0A1E3HB07_9TREE|nr:hypothetical protein L202_08361 [Cryptococcus amylolentus CBS 6039]ODN72956.1 hypothetical protein L202_08361 [Cryptococcus amylolentus CBS 6039]
MTDSQLQKGLSDCRISCHQAAQALSAIPKDVPMPHGLPDAFCQLLANLRQSLTSLGLAFKPPVTIPAALQQLEKISEQINQLISCAIMAKGELGKEWKEGISAVEGELERHIQVLESGGDYLRSTGMVWETIDRMTKDISKDERSAVIRRWKSHQSVIKDAWEEYKETLEGDGENEDDGWDELGLGEGSLSDEEKARSTAIKPLLALHQLLHASMPRYLPQLPENDLTLLLTLSENLIDAYDELVSATHPGQDEEEIREASIRLRDLSLKMASVVTDKSIDKWKERFQQEQEKWESRKLDMSNLSEALRDA